MPADDRDQVESVHDDRGPADDGQLLGAEEAGSLALVEVLSAAVRKLDQRFGQSEGGAFLIGEELGVTPGRQDHDVLLCLVGLQGVTHVDAQAAGAGIELGDAHVARSARAYSKSWRRGTALDGAGRVPHSREDVVKFSCPGLTTCTEPSPSWCNTWPPVRHVTVCGPM